MTETAASAAWDREYERSRYAGEPALPFVQDILTAVHNHGLGGAAVLDIGAGNGRNLRHLLRAGLDVTGLDISRVAVSQLAAEFPERREKFVCGNLSALPGGTTWPVIVGLQVFQHGDRATAHAHIRAAQNRLRPGGLLAIRVNATATDLWPAHDIVEADSGCGLTICYREGPKRGLTIHFFDPGELAELFTDGFTPVLAPRLVSQARTAPAPGQWTQIEAIWRRHP